MSHDDNKQQHFKTLIIGSGISGIVSAIELRKRLGFIPEDYLIVDKSTTATFGGTWSANTYPGAACDVPAHIYSLSDTPNPSWSEKWPPQSEILAYLDGVARKYNLHASTRFGTEVVECRWLAAPACRWSVTLRQVDGGKTYTVTATAVITGVGQLSRPYVPDIPGLATFGGPVVHSAHWDHAIDFANKKVAVVGTGPSAIQFVPEVLKAPGVSMDVFQRSPGYVIFKGNFKYPALVRWLFRYVPFVRALYRSWHIFKTDINYYAFNKNYPLMGALGTFFAKWYMRSQIRDPKLREILIPGFAFGCKRTLLSDDWLECMQRPNVAVVTDKITAVAPGAVVTTAPDGSTAMHPADVLLLGTGFKSTEFLQPIEFYGEGGARLHDVWASKGGPEAYKGVLVSGFPNLFVLYGPNVNLGHHSIILMIEYSMNLATNLLRLVFPTSKTAKAIPYVNVTDAAQTEYNKTIQRQLADTSFASPTCSNWYRIGDKVVNNWPLTVRRFQQMTSTIEVNDLVQFGDEPRRSFRRQEQRKIIKTISWVAFLSAGVFVAARLSRGSL